MYNINYVLAVDQNWALGYKGDLIYFFKKDLQRFKDITMGKCVIMGSKTWKSLPMKLPQRKNVVLTSKTFIEDEKQPDILVHNIEDILNISKNEEVWIIGGKSLYNKLIEYVNKIELTIIENHDSKYDVDVLFLRDELKKFDLVSSETFFEEDINSYKKMNIKFNSYKKMNMKN
jgi:dihydrofolate reductase